MIESQIVQLVVVVPPIDKGKIPGLPKDLETVNLVDVHNAAYYYYTEPSTKRWIDYVVEPPNLMPSREYSSSIRH
jgi:hypothetical protein